MAHMRTGLEAARRRLAEVIAAFFDDRRRTGEARDVAIMILVGLDHVSIARVRKTASGHVAAQATRLHSRSATDRRAQVVSPSMEESMPGEIAPQQGTDRQTPPAQTREPASAPGQPA